MTAISKHKLFAMAVMLCASVMTLSSGSNLFCSCIWTGPFMAAADDFGSVMVHAKILGYSVKKISDNNQVYSSMDIEVHEVLKGTIPTKKLSILMGTIDMGHSHIPTPDAPPPFPFAADSEYILVLKENPQGYSRASSCTPFDLLVKDGKVIGKNITDLHFNSANQEMPLSEFTEKLKQIATPPMPKASIRMSGSDKPAISGKGVTPPILLESPAPPYPEEAKKRNIEGDVIVHAIVRKDGSVDKVMIVGSLDHDLDQSAIDTIGSRWRFAPGTVSGEPVDVRIIIRYSFRFDSPLRVAILDQHFGFGFGGRLSTVGYGNITENGSVRGFEYTIPELGEFWKEEYPAVWKNPQSDLEIRVYDDITGQPHVYKAKVAMKDFMYQKKDDVLTTLPVGTEERIN
jgi:TonB family protein